VTATDTHRAIDAVWRIESPRLIAGLARLVRDIGVAEDLGQDAPVAARPPARIPGRVALRPIAAMARVRNSQNRIARAPCGRARACRLGGAGDNVGDRGRLAEFGNTHMRLAQKLKLFLVLVMGPVFA